MAAKETKKVVGSKWSRILASFIIRHQDDLIKEDREMKADWDKKRKKITYNMFLFKNINKRQ